jgi:hypothetical protein
MTTTRHFQDLIRKLGELLAEPHTSFTTGLQQKYRAACVAALAVSSKAWSNKTFKEMVQEKVSNTACI